MSSKDKELSKSKFKSFFKCTRNAAGFNERCLRSEIDWELRPEQPVSQRCKILKDLSEFHLQSYNLEESAIIKLWDVTKDLLAPTKSAECRQTALLFYKKLIYTQYKNLTFMREQFFGLIQKHEVGDDLKHRLELLDVLTENGRNINNLEEKIGAFMLSWLPAINKANLLRPYLEILINLIKFNAAHLENEMIVAVVRNACHLSCTVSDEDIGLQCLTILEMIMSYTIFPSDPLPQFIFTLCRTVNLAPYCRVSWKIMKNLLGTELGYHSMKMMCNILKDRNFREDDYLLRGAVFHLNMNIFNATLVFQVSPLFYATMVLNSFLRALDSRHITVTYEVILGIHIVINKYKADLPEIIWDRICDIMSVIIDNIEYYDSLSTITDGLLHLKNYFHETINCIEKFLQDEKSHLLVNYDRIYDLIERVADCRSEESVLNLIDYRSSKITATKPEWIYSLSVFVQRFFKMSNTNIRIRIIQSLVYVMDANRLCYEEEILERVIIPLFSSASVDNDVQMRVAVSKALIELVRNCDTKRCGELLDILEKIINRPFEYFHHSGSGMKYELEISDVIAAVHGLIEVFLIKVYCLPSCHAIKIFNILMGHLELHYDNPKVFDQINITRYKIFKWMLNARANASYHIGFPDSINREIIKYSYYLGIDSSLPLHGMSHHHQRHQVMSQLNSHDIVPNTILYTTISIRRACKIIVMCLENDKDFQIFQLVIKELPKVLQNKALIQGNDIELLALALFKIIFENSKTLHNMYKCSIDDLNALVLPAIAALVIYHPFIQLAHQYKIIEVLKMGILSGISNICINTMTTIILEMPEALMRKLPDILLQMSKMSDTMAVAIPVLEFLSILSRLSNDLFTNFTPRQYMYVFAISLPYTKPHRYDHYTVSLAHHVIAGWFLKCKLELRKNCVTYIISSIQSNASMLYEDINTITRNIQRQDFNSLNEDSASRKRSTSLTERGSRNSVVNNRNDSQMRPLMNASLKSFHAELAETCIDFLARHTFSPCSALPKRLPAVEYLLKDGYSQTWLVGHNLITITSSGCPSGPSRTGLCDRCEQLAKTYSLSPKNISNKNLSSATIISSGFGKQSKSVTSGNVNHTNTVSNEHNVSIHEQRYYKGSLRYNTGNDFTGSTDLMSSSNCSQRHPSNSSTASLEMLSRRVSNPETNSYDLADITNSQIQNNKIEEIKTEPGDKISSYFLDNTTWSGTCSSPICVRSCSTWAEIFIRRPTGNISWITRIQNPISNECLGHDIPFSCMVKMFLPTAYGGVFGPNCLPSDKTIRFNDSRISDKMNVKIVFPRDKQPQEFSRNIKDMINNTNNISLDDTRKSIYKTKLLQTKDEIMSSMGIDVMVGSAAIDIPKIVSTKRNKETLSSSVSDGEAEDDSKVFENQHSHSRKPVRRVNSSPEMSSSWRNHFLNNKNQILHREFYNGHLENLLSDSQEHDNQLMQQQQKKKTVQYLKVSYEAIPEEIAGFTPPRHILTSTESLHTSDVYHSSPCKEKSTNDVNQISVVSISDVQQSVSAICMPKILGTYSEADVSTDCESTSAVGLENGKFVKSHSTDDTFSPYIPTNCQITCNLSEKTSLANRTRKNINSMTYTSMTISSLSPSFGSHQSLAKSSSSGNAVSVTSDTGIAYGGDMMRGRSKTISVVREVNNVKSRGVNNFRVFSNSTTNTKSQLSTKLCMHPSFIFMQLYHTGQLPVADVPIKVPAEQMSAISLLDLAPPFETHKIGVLYVGEGQCNNVIEILRNSHGSTRYVEFLHCIGTLVSLKDTAKHNLFVTLDTGGADGKFTYVWKDDIVQVTFHVATLMPTKLDSDPNCNEKKKHIGNDYVNIVYNESGEDYNLNTISGQYNYACVIVEPLELNSNRIYVKARPEIAKFVSHPEPKIVSDNSAPLLARQLALHANLASHVYQSLQKKNPYASNWLERLRIIKRLRTKLIENQNNISNQSGTLASDINDVLNKQNTNHDFTKYT